MTWKEIKHWAKSKGYNATKLDNGYSWELIEDSNIKGLSTSVSKLARDIFNNITNNKFKTHQENYKQDIDYERSTV